MKKIFLALLLALPFLLNGQNHIWKTYALSSGFDGGNAILPAPGGGYAIFGRRHDGTGTFSYNNDGFFLRVDKEGNQLAYSVFGTPNSNEFIGRGVIPVANGWIAAGSKSAPNNATRGWLLNINTSGNTVWTKEISLPGISSIEFSKLAALPDGGFMAVGSANAGILVARFTDNGDLVWWKTFGSGSGVSLYVSAGGGNCFVVTRSKILKIRTSNGNLQWEKTLAPPPFGPANTLSVSFKINDITPAGVGQFAVVGTVYADLVTEIYSGYYAALWKESGEVVWEKYLNADYSGFTINEGYSAEYMPNAQNLLFTGTINDKTNVTRLNMSGITVASFTLNESGNHYFATLIRDGGYYVITGTTLNTFFYRSGANALGLSSSGGPNSDVVSSSPAEPLSVHPNPATEEVNVGFESAIEEELQFCLFDVTGKVVLQTTCPAAIGTNRLVINLNNCAPGVYWLASSSSNWLPQKIVKL